MSPRTLVLLHGANGSAQTLQPLSKLLGASATLQVPNLLGHGGRPVPGRYSVADIADDLVGWLDQHRIGPAYVLGYSFGGYVALYLARHHPGRVLGVGTLAAKVVYDLRTVRQLSHLTNPGRLSQPGNPRAAQLTRTHHPQDWTRVTCNNRELFLALGREPALNDDDLRAITAPALVISGENDQLVPAAETRALGDLLPRRRVLLFKGPAHPLEMTPLPAIAQAVDAWMRDIENHNNDNRNSAT